MFRSSVLARYDIQERESDAVRTYRREHAQQDAEDPANYRPNPEGWRFVREMPPVDQHHVFLFETKDLPRRRKKPHDGPEGLWFLISDSPDHSHAGFATLQLARIPPYEQEHWAVKWTSVQKQYRGQGLGLLLYKIALSHTGALFSDILVSDAARKSIWDKLAQDAHVKVDFAKRKLDRHKLSLPERMTDDA